VVVIVIQCRPSVAVGVTAVDDISVMAMYDQKCPHFWSRVCRQVSGR
jgi:hypothetical protein